MPNPITGNDLYQNTGELEVLKEQLVGINESIASVLSNASQLKRVMAALNGGKVGDQKQIADLAIKVNQLQKSFEQLTQAKQRTEQQIIRTSQARQKEIAEANRAALVHQKLRTEYTRTQIAQERLRQTQDRSNASARRWAGSLSGLLQSIRTLTYAYFSLSAAQRIVGSFFTETKTLNSLDLAYSKVMGSTEEVAKAKEYLIGLTDRLGLSYISTADAYLKFGAAARQANLPVEETNKIFESVSKSAAFLGLSTERVSLVFLALEQIISKGKLQTEELRRQLGEHLPGAFGIAAEAMGVTAGELTDLLKKGKVYSNEFLPKFARQLEIAYGLQNVNRIDNLASAQARFNNEFTALVRELDAAGAFTDFFNALTKGLKFVTENIDQILFLGKIILKVGTYWVAYKLGIIAATRALPALRALLISISTINPFGLAAVAITLLLPLIVTLIDRMNGVSEAAKRMKGTLNAMTEEIIEENTEARKNVDVLRSLNSTQRERESALERLIQKYPDILAKYDIEKLSLADLVNLEKELAGAITERAAAQREAEVTTTYLKSLEEAAKFVPAVFGTKNRVIGEGAGLGVEDDIARERQKMREAANKQYMEEMSLIKQTKKEAFDFIKEYNEQENSLVGKQRGRFSLIRGEQALVNEARIRETEIKKELTKLSDDELRKVIRTKDVEIIRKKLAMELLTLRNAKGGGDDDGGDPDANFRKQISRRKKLNEFLNDGIEKELELLKIKLDEEVHFNELGQLGEQKLLERYQKQRQDILWKYAIKNRDLQVDAMAEGKKKEFAELDLWLDKEIDRYVDQGQSITELLQRYRDAKTEIENKYIDEQDNDQQKAFENEKAFLEERFNVAQELFRTQTESLLLTNDQRNQLQLLQDIQALEERKRMARLGFESLNEDELALINAQIEAKKAAWRDGEIEIGIQRIQIENRAAEASINASKKSEYTKNRLKIEAAIKYWEDLIKIDTRMSDIEKQIIFDTITALKNELDSIKSDRNLFDILGIEISEERFQALIKALEYAKQYINEYFNNLNELYDQSVNKSKELVDQRQQEYEQQISLANAGHANSVETAKKELALAKQKNEQALKDQEKFQKAQLVANTALEASNLAVGLSKIVKDLGPLAPFAIGAVLAAFIAAKITAFRVSRKKFRKGGYEEVEGGSHESGHDTPIGTLKDGSLGFAERGEAVGVFTGKAKRRYGNRVLKELVDAANRGTLDRIMRQDEFASFPYTQNNYVDTGIMERRLAQLVKQGEGRSYVDGNGNLIYEDRGRKTIVRK